MFSGWPWVFGGNRYYLQKGCLCLPIWNSSTSFLELAPTSRNTINKVVTEALLVLPGFQGGHFPIGFSTNNDVGYPGMSFYSYFTNNFIRNRYCAWVVWVLGMFVVSKLEWREVNFSKLCEGKRKSPPRWKKNYLCRETNWQPIWLICSCLYPLSLASVLFQSS